METIISHLSERLGLPEATIRSGLGVLLRFLREKAEPGQFDAVVGMVPGMKELLAMEPVAAAPVDASAAAPESPAGGGGLLGSLLGGGLSGLGGLAGLSKLGGLGELGKLVGSGDLGGVLSGLQNAGIPAQQAIPLARAFVEEVRKEAGPEGVEKLLSAVPALKALFTS
jgi:predicted lipid-binding transport protein (Tim44 family)